jgi:hypothetical protein
MELIGTINATNREIFYLSTQIKNWELKLPQKNWLAFLINDDDNNKELLHQFVSNCKIKNVLHIKMYQTDIAQEKIEVDIENIIKHNVNLLSSYLEMLGVVKYQNLERGFWEITNVSKVDFLAKFSDGYKVVCLDCKNRSSKIELLDLINRFNDGWIPKI